MASYLLALRRRAAVMGVAVKILFDIALIWATVASFNTLLDIFSKKGRILDQFVSSADRNLALTIYRSMVGMFLVTTLCFAISAIALWRWPSLAFALVLLPVLFFGVSAVLTRNRRGQCMRR